MVLSALKSVFLRVLSPVVDLLIKSGVSPNAITTFGTVATIIGGGFYARGHIALAGWIVGLSAICDLLDGHVARRTGRTTVFGAFYDSTLDRIADGAVLGGLAMFFARNGVHHKIPDFMSTPMVSVLLLGILGSFLTSYTRARAEGLGIDAKVGILQRPERIVLLSAPQAFFGLAFGGWLLIAICVLLTVTAWITVVQRVLFVYRVTAAVESSDAEGHQVAKTRKSRRDAERETVGPPTSWFGGIAQLGDRMLRSRESADAHLSDGVAQNDSTTRRTEAGHPTTFDRAR